MSLTTQLNSISTSIAGAKGFVTKLETKRVASAGPQARSMLADASREIALMRKEITKFQKSLKTAKPAKAEEGPKEEEGPTEEEGPKKAAPKKAASKKAAPKKEEAAEAEEPGLLPPPEKKALRKKATF